MTETQKMLSELTRVKALFQARSIATILGATPPQKLTPAEPLPLPSLQDKDR